MRLGTFRGFGTERARLGTFRGFAKKLSFFTQKIIVLFKSFTNSIRTNPVFFVSTVNLEVKV